MFDTARVLQRYAKVLVWLGLSLATVALLLDFRWIEQPIPTLVILVAVAALRASPVRLSKYSYLTQHGVPVVVGILVAAPSQVVAGMAAGVYLVDTLWLRKPMGAGLVNAGRESIAFMAAFGIFALVWRLSGSPSTGLDFLPAAFTLAGTYFFLSRALFYFTLLLRDKLESEERLLILRYEVVAYLLTLGAAAIVVGAIQVLSPPGWAAVLAVVGVFGLLTKKILEEAIAAEDLNKVHLMETAITTNVTLMDSFQQIERLAHRLLDWGDLRIYRRDDHDVVTLAYRGEVGRGGRGEVPAELEPLRRQAIATAEPVIVHDTSKDARMPMAASDTQSLVILPLRFGSDVIGTLELEHHKRHMYRGRDLAAMATLATQVATAIHIAELRRPLVTTVDSIGSQVGALARATESLHASADALTAASKSLRFGLAEQDAFVTAGLQATKALASGSAEMAIQGKRAAEASGRASETAARNRETIRDAIRRLVDLKHFVAESSRQVDRAGQRDEADHRVHRLDPRNRRPDEPDFAQRRHRGGAGGAGGEGVRRGGGGGARAGRPERRGRAGGRRAPRRHRGTGHRDHRADVPRRARGGRRGAARRGGGRGARGDRERDPRGGHRRAADRRDGGPAGRGLRQAPGADRAPGDGVRQDPRGDQRPREPGGACGRGAGGTGRGDPAAREGLHAPAVDRAPLHRRRLGGGGGGRGDRAGEQPRRPGGPSRRRPRGAGGAPRHPRPAHLDGGGDGAPRRARPARLPEPGRAGGDVAGTARAARGLPGHRARRRTDARRRGGPRAPSTWTSFGSAGARWPNLD